MLTLHTELSFRGDFRTTTGYLVKLLEEEIFVQNRFSTGWLDKLISAQVQSDRPDPHLVAVCGMVFKAAKTWENNDKEALSAVEKGQTPRKSLLATSSTVDFIYDGMPLRAETDVYRRSVQVQSAFYWSRVCLGNREWFQQSDFIQADD